MDSSEKIAIEIITEIFKSSIIDLKQIGINKLKEKDFFGLSASKYCKKILEQYNSIKVLGMEEPIPLKELYIRVNIFSKKNEIPRKNLDALQQKITDQIIIENNKTIVDKKNLEKIKNSRDLNLEMNLSEYVAEADWITPFRSVIETKGALEIVKSENKLIVLGKPGSGKTTFLKYLALKAISDKNLFQSKKIPIIITLKKFTESGIDLIEYIIEQFEISNLEKPELFIINLLENGKCLILLDGLDEVAESELDSTISKVTDFSDKYSKNKFIISCRVAAYSFWFNQFTDIELADFNEFQIKEFISKWFSKEKSMALECWKSIQSNIRFLELASTPLLLTLICIAYDKNYEFPYTRAELYEESTNALLKNWDSTRRIRRDSGTKFSIKRKESLYSRIAIETFKNNQYFIKEKILFELIEDFFRSLNNLDFDDMELDLHSFANKLISHHGLLVKRSFRIYSFSHLSIQEYFTARYIKDNLDSNSLNWLVSNFLWEVRWREFFLITSDLLTDSGNFVQLIYKSINNEINKNENLKKLIKIVNYNSTKYNNSIFLKGISFAIMVGYIKKTIDFEDFKSSDIIYASTSNLFYTCLNSETAPYVERLRSNLSHPEIYKEIDIDLNFFMQVNQFIYGFNLLILCMNSDMEYGIWKKKKNRIRSF